MDPKLIDDIETPAVVVDQDVMEANLRRCQEYADRHGIALRPHIKTHKMPHLAKLQMSLGARGITCQKLGEVEVMAQAGIDDILVTFPIVGAAKLARLSRLAQAHRLSVVADSAEVVDGLSAAMATAGVTLNVLVECDTGGRRCGTQDAEQTVALAARIDRSPGLRFGGLMTYPPKGQTDATRVWLQAALAGLASSGLAAEIVSVGGTPDLYRAHELEVATEHRPGTYIYSDRSMVQLGLGTLDDCALHVVATVVSRPTAERAIIDAGSKTLSSDTLGLDGFGTVLEYPDARIAALSEEHGHLDVAACARRPRIGERLTIVPNHACVVSNLAEFVHFARGGRVERSLPAAARGRVT